PRDAGGAARNPQLRSLRSSTWMRALPRLIRRYSRKLWIGGNEKGGVTFLESQTQDPEWQLGGKETPPMVRIEEEGSEGKAELVGMTLDELARAGAQRMLRTALEAEVDAYVTAHREHRAADGTALVVRNGPARPRKVTLGSGTIEVRAPRVDDRRVDAVGGGQRFRSRILPPSRRRSPKVAEVLPILYLRGLPTGDFRAALPVLLGEDAAGLSPTTITRLTAEWEQDYQAFQQRDLSARDYIYIWVDGVHFTIRL